MDDLFEDISYQIEELERQVESFQKENESLMYSLRLKQDRIQYLEKLLTQNNIQYQKQYG